MIKKFIKSLFTSGKAVSQSDGYSCGVAAPTGGSREARKKLMVRAKKPVFHKAHSYPFKQHGINPKHIPESARVVTQTLVDAGFEAYVVGGAVRDLMLGHIPKDFDVATNARPEQVTRLFRRARIIGRRFRIVHVMHKRDLIEVTTFRSEAVESQETDEHGRVLRDNVYGGIESDAQRRDLTINGLYYDVNRQVVLDYHGGVPDLRDRVLRIIGEPVLRFREDPVRMLRVLRFVAKLDFDVDPATLDAMQSCKELLVNIPSARLFDETLKFFTTGHAAPSMDVLQDYDFTEFLMPVLHEQMQSERSADWVYAALEGTDDRVAEGKSLSPGFLFAALLWPKVEERWAFYQTEQPELTALDMAMNEGLSQNGDQVVMTKRFTADMREIWSLQPRLQRRMPRHVPKLLAHPRFRAAYDFLLLRAQVGHLGDEGLEIGQWWGLMYAADGAERERMLQDLRQMGKGAAGEGVPKKRRRRKSKSKSASADVSSDAPLGTGSSDE